LMSLYCFCMGVTGSIGVLLYHKAASGDKGHYAWGEVKPEG